MPYLVLGAAWVFFPDRVLLALVGNPEHDFDRCGFLFVNHRIMNNVQIMSSLLSLENDTTQERNERISARGRAMAITLSNPAQGFAGFLIRVEGWNPKAGGELLSEDLMKELSQQLYGEFVRLSFPTPGGPVDV